MYVRKEAVLSSQIEGTQSSLQHLLVAEANLLGDEATAGDVDEVINYVRAMNYGLGRLAEMPVEQLVEALDRVRATAVAA